VTPMSRRKRSKDAARSNGRALVAIDPAYEQAVRKHERALPDLMPNYEKICQDIAECWRVDEVKEIDDKAEALRCYARIIHNHEAQTKWALVRVRAWHRIGEITRSVKTAPHGPGRGHKSRPGAGTPFPSKTAFLRDLGISRSRANLGEHISKNAMKEFEDCAAKGLAQGQAVGFEEMVDTVLKRRRLNPGVRTRPWSNNDEGLFGLEANGEKLSYAGRLYRMTKRLSVAERIKHIVRVAADLPERPWHPVLGWLFTEREVTNLLQDLSQRPLAEHEKLLHDLTKDNHEQYSSVVDFNEVTKEAHKQQEQRRPPRTKKVERKKSGNRRHVSETQAAHQSHA
jgi:hypothetical protein